MKNIFTFFIVFHFFNTAYAIKPDSTYRWKPNIYGLMFKEYNVITKDNYKLKAWFYPAQQILEKDSINYYFNKKTELRPYKIDKKKKPTIIICNGDSGNMSQLISYGYYYCSHGFNVLTFDWRGFGESQSFPIDSNYLVYTEFLTDYNAIISFVKQIETVDTNKIGAFGFSTGAFLTFAVASIRKEVKAIVARAIFTDYESTKIILNRIDTRAPFLIPEDIDEYSPRANWGSFKKPLFLIVGEKDKRTPKENSIEIISNVRSRVRELWIVKNAKHGGNFAPEVIETILFYDKTIRFFNENL